VNDIMMPSLSDSMEEGTIVKWLKSDGQRVALGEDLVEIETDKATMTYASEHEGTLQIVATEGTTVAVGATIAKLGEAAQTPAPADGPADAPSGNGELAEAPVGTPSGNGELGDAGHHDHGDAGGSAAAAGGRVLATPLARRTATEHEVDLSRLRGTGPRGRVRRADVLAAAGISAPPPPTSRAPAGEAAPEQLTPSGARGDPEIQVPSRLQQVIARRMSEAKGTIPEFDVQTEVVMDDAVAMRTRLKEISAGEPLPSINDFVVKACAVALTRHRRINASYEDGKFRLHGRINVGVAVAAEDALLVPTVYDADTKSLGAITQEVRHLTERVRSGEITPPELTGGTFTVSNLGMFGMTAIRPVINPPQAAILGVGSIRAVLARAGDEIIERSLMTITLVSDHRVLYGADAARFLADVRGLLEFPFRLAL